MLAYRIANKAVECSVQEDFYGIQYGMAKKTKVVDMFLQTKLLVFHHCGMLKN
jgi:hypothetical protein